MRNAYPIQSSVVQRQVKRAKYLLVREWSDTIPVQDNGKKTILSSLHFSQLHVFALDIHIPVSIPP